MKVNVTQEDIDRGSRCSSVSCPVALAVEREFGGGIAVSVGIFDILVCGSKTFTARLPHHAYRFILDFDDGHRVKPFDFDVDLSEM